jgi:transposase
MYILKKYQEGLAVINDDSGQSRLLSPEEEKEVLEVLPQLKDSKTASIFVDKLPDGLKVTVRSEIVQ